MAIIARKNDQSSFLCNSEPSNANTEVLRLKQVHYIEFIAYFFKYSLKAQNVNFLKTPASENSS